MKQGESEARCGRQRKQGRVAAKSHTAEGRKGCREEQRWQYREVPAKRARSPSLAFSFESVSALGPSKERREVPRWLELDQDGLKFQLWEYREVPRWLEVPALGVPQLWEWREVSGWLEVDQDGFQGR